MDGIADRLAALDVYPRPMPARVGSQANTHEMMGGRS